MNIQEIKVRSVITKSNLPEADYVINPYGGCNHGCIYCYACFMKRFSGHTEAWGSYVDVKINAPQLIPEKSEKYKNKKIFLSSVTDPYLPLEKKYCLTRQILEKLIPLNPILDIQTKSSLITRDIDLLKQFENLRAGLTISILDEKIRKKTEPYTSPINKRMEALKTLKAGGLKTYLFMGPIYPYITDWKQIIQQTREYTDYYMFENLNMRGSFSGAIKQWLIRNHTDLAEPFLAVYQKGSSYWHKKEDEIRTFCTNQKINFEIFFHHGK